MSVIGKFFGGMSITGYVITMLVTVVLGLSIVTLYLNRANNDLHAEVAVSQHAILTLVDVNQQNRVSINQLEQLATECADKRTAAEKAAKEAKLELSLRTLESSHKTTSRTESIRNEIPQVPAECIACVVPPRTVRLLIDAACSANRGTDCP